MTIRMWLLVVGLVLALRVKPSAADEMINYYYYPYYYAHYSYSYSSSMPAASGLFDAFDTNGDSQLTADEAAEPLSSYVGLGTDDAITAMVECAFLVADEDGT